VAVALAFLVVIPEADLLLYSSLPSVAILLADGESAFASPAQVSILQYDSSIHPPDNIFPSSL
jgi:hypothetical protein